MQGGENKTDCYQSPEEIIARVSINQKMPSLPGPEFRTRASDEFYEYLDGAEDQDLGIGEEKDSITVEHYLFNAY